MPIRGRFDPVAWAADPHRTRTGDILVTAVTNVGRTPLFPRQAAIVTAALEPGIPAAVSCGNLTALLHWRRSALTADTARCRSTTTPTHHAASSDRAGTGPAAGARRNDFAAQSPDPAAMSVATGRTQASTSCSLVLQSGFVIFPVIVWVMLALPGVVPGSDAIGRVPGGVVARCSRCS
jgi:hypothetical protein